MRAGPGLVVCAAVVAARAGAFSERRAAAHWAARSARGRRRWPESHTSGQRPRSGPGRCSVIQNVGPSVADDDEKSCSRPSRCCGRLPASFYGRAAPLRAGPACVHTGLGSWRARRGRRMVRRPRRLQRHANRRTSRVAGGPRRARCAGGGCAGRCPARSHRPRRGPGGRDRTRGRARWCAPCERDGRRQRRLARGRLPAHGHRRGGTVRAGNDSAPAPARRWPQSGRAGSWSAPFLTALRCEVTECTSWRPRRSRRRLPGRATCARGACRSGRWRPSWLPRDGSAVEGAGFCPRKSRVCWPLGTGAYSRPPNSRIPDRPPQDPANPGRPRTGSPPFLNGINALPIPWLQRHCPWHRKS